MKKNFIEDLTITNVYQTQPHENVMVLYFKTNEQPYSVRTSNLNGYFEPSAVFHETNETCSFCGKKRLHAQCKILRNQREELFQRLINHPSIRLEWLFIQHESPTNKL